MKRKEPMGQKGNTQEGKLGETDVLEARKEKSWEKEHVQSIATLRSSSMTVQFGNVEFVDDLVQCLFSRDAVGDESQLEWASNTTGQEKGEIK